jgi:hypothetical protein
MAVMTNEKRLKKLLEDVMMSLLEDDENDSEEKEYSEDEEIDADDLDDKEFFLHGHESGAPSDEEGQMAKSQLHRIKQIAYMLCDMLESGDQLPAWVQDHVSVAHENLGQVFSYMEPKYHMAGSEDDDEDEENWSDEELLNPEELGEAKKGLWANMHARRKAGKKRKRPGEKGYPKTLKIDK